MSMQLLCYFVFFFFKQKTAYDMRISDWSSDVCSSDLAFMTVKKFNITEHLKQTSEVEGAESNRMLGLAFQGQGQLDMAFEKFRRVQPVDDRLKIGRASCRERVC